VSGSVRPSQYQPHQVPDDNIPTYGNVYSHPAAVAYAAAYPHRTILKFGPYVLLQTLGEGGSGRVKLCLHMQWLEEVAVGLVRRGSLNTPTRMLKIESHIEILKVGPCPIRRLFNPQKYSRWICVHFLL